MDSRLNRIVTTIEECGWSVEENSEKDRRYITIGRYSAFGLDFSFDIDIPHEDYDREDCECIIADSIATYYENFDVSSEAYVWLDNEGHGKNGAPHDMGALYNDIAGIDNHLRELSENTFSYSYNKYR